MNEDEFSRRQQRARNQSIWYKGKLQPPRSEKRTICNVHLELANKIDSAFLMSEKDRAYLLKLVDEAYNMGKRMDNALDYYAELTGKDKKDAAVS